MAHTFDNPLIVQGDHTVLLETMGPRYQEGRDALLRFAELVKSPEYIHTWRITPLSLWNAAAAGWTPDRVIETLTALAKYPIPENIPQSILLKMGRYGALRLVRDGRWLLLEARDELLFDEVRQLVPVQGLIGEPESGKSGRVLPKHRGELKAVLTHAGYPVEDLAGYDDGDPLEIKLRMPLEDGTEWSLREYQVEAIDAFCGGPDGGNGVVVLPAGAGKTLVGIGVMARLGMRTLLLCTGHTSLRQWKRHILAHTHLTEEDVGEYSGAVKQLRPVTITTYQVLTWRARAGAVPAHFRLFHEANWGLIVYDEVHLLPAPIFRETAYLQARRRLGLTATLVREDGREVDVFSLVGPKRFDMPWKVLEHQGWIATARCVEVRVALTDVDRARYVSATPRARPKIAATNPRKSRVVADLIARHTGRQILVLGTYLDQLHWVGRTGEFPVVSGKTPKKERDRLFGEFRSGGIPVLGLSKVGNFSIDLPGASVAIQISGSFGSRQEEAQRLGRVLRPKEGDNSAVFYTLITPDTREAEFAERRQRFLAEQGYPYRIEVVA
jgi:DNA excision repair protein ERCC-3